MILISLKRYLIVFVSIFIFSNVLSAQNNDSLIIRSFEALEVTASRIEGVDLSNPIAIPIINTNQQQPFYGSQPLLAADEVLNYIPGVFALNPSNYAQDLRISIRGFGSRAAFGIRGIKLLVDGLPETTPDGQSQVDNLSLGIIDQYEIIKGPASGLYGNASGGVMNLVTADGRNAPLLSGRMMFGSFGLQQYQLNIGDAVGKLDYFIHAIHTKQDGFREHSEVENNVINAKLRYDIGKKGKLSLIVNHVNSPIANDPGGINLENVREDRRQARDANLRFNGGEAITQSKIGLVYKQKIGEKHRITGRAYYLSRDFANRLPFEFGGIVEIDRTFSGFGVAYRYKNKFGTLDYLLKLGIDYDNQVDDRSRFRNLEGERGNPTFDQEESFSSLGAYLTQEFTLNKWRLIAGLRFDALQLEAKDRFLTNGDESGSIDLDNFNPVLGLSYRLGKTTFLYGNYSTTFETPTLSELSNNPDGGGGFNPDLKPQKATNYELGLKGIVGKQLKYSMAVFHIDLEDELLPFEIEAFPGRTFFRNIGESQRNGLEVEASYLLTKGLTAQLAYTYSNFTFGDFFTRALEGNQIPGLPKHLLSGQLRYLSTKGFYAGLQARQVGMLFLNDTNTQSDNSYALVNIMLGHSIRLQKWNLNPFLGINNLFDTSYNANIRINAFGNRFFEPGPGINIFGGLRVSFR